jgi:hypothetical protein
MMWGVGWSAGAARRRHLPRRWLRPQQGPGQPRALRPAGLQRAVRAQRVLPDGPERGADAARRKKLMVAYMPYKATRTASSPTCAPLGGGLPPHPSCATSGATSTSTRAARRCHGRGRGCRRDEAPRACRCRGAFWARRWPGLAAGAAAPGCRGRRARCCATPSRRRDRLRPGADQRPVLAHRHAAHLRGAATATTTWRGRQGSAAHADGMPEVSADFRTWTVRSSPGIFFADDPAFKGSARAGGARTTSTPSSASPTRR